MTTRQIYDPHTLVRQVIELLRAHGLDPDLSPGYLGEATAGAGRLLRSVGITPGLDSLEAMIRSSERVHGESTDVP